MEQAKVAGTVILNKVDGGKKFLVKKIRGQVEFVIAEVDGAHTSLACILNEFKEEAHLDTKKMDLVELTSVSLNNDKIPLFVFSLDEMTECDKRFGNDYIWEEPSMLRRILKDFKISGVPYLS